MGTPVKRKPSAEYTIAVRRQVDERDGQKYTVFEVRTVREFASFQYVLHVDGAYDAAARDISIRIGGVTVPPSLMPGSGPAIGGFAQPGLAAGQYTLTVRKGAKDVNHFKMTIGRTNMITLMPQGGEKLFVGIRE